MKKILIATLTCAALLSPTFLNAQNPKTWKNNTGYSPEIGGSATAFGIDANPYPMPAVYTFGLNLTF